MGQTPHVLVNLQLGNENAVSSLPGTREEVSSGLQSWWDTPLEIPLMILYIPRDRGCSICSARACGETESQVLAQTRPARSPGHITAVFPGCMGNAEGLRDVLCWPTLVMWPLP